MDFEGRSIACLVEGADNFALLEALARVFFPHVPMSDFLYAVNEVLKIQLKVINCFEIVCILNNLLK